MKLRRQKGGQAEQAVTLIEVAVIVAILVLLLGMLLPRLARGERTAKRDRCVNNLKNIGLAYRVFSTDHGDKYPMQLSVTNGGSLEFREEVTSIWRRYFSLSNELGTAKILVCPKDKERMEASVFGTNRPFGEGASSLRAFNTNRNISYFVGLDADETRPNMLLTGDRWLTNGPPVLFRFGQATIGSLGTNQTHYSRGAGWHAPLHGAGGQVAQGDGSVQQYTSAGLRDALRNSGDDQNRIANPD
jgi:type II secretory pathway pseudopilin PulG